MVAARCAGKKPATTAVTRRMVTTAVIVRDGRVDIAAIDFGTNSLTVLLGQ